MVRSPPSNLLSSNPTQYCAFLVLDPSIPTHKHSSRSTAPKTPAELRPQYGALCRVFNLDPTSSATLTILRDPSLVPATTLLHVIETDKIGIEHGTFRGCLDGTWLPTSPDPMTWQRTGTLAHKLREKGVTSIGIGDLSEEWYLYAIAHPVGGPRDVLPNLLRYYPREIVERLVSMYKALEEGASEEEAARWMGEVLSDGQVYAPVRMFVRDFHKAGFPVFRYAIRWTPEQVRPKGKAGELVHVRWTANLGCPQDWLRTERTAVFGRFASRA